MHCDYLQTQMSEAHGSSAQRLAVEPEHQFGAASADVDCQRQLVVNRQRVHNQIEPRKQTSDFTSGLHQSQELELMQNKSARLRIVALPFVASRHPQLDHGHVHTCRLAIHHAMWLPSWPRHAQPLIWQRLAEPEHCCLHWQPRRLLSRCLRMSGQHAIDGAVPAAAWQLDG